MHKFFDAQKIICMITCTRTTLVLDDSTFEKAKRRAIEMGITLSELTSLPLKALLMKQSPPKQVPFIKLPTYGVKGEIKQFRDEEYVTLSESNF